MRYVYVPVGLLTSIMGRENVENVAVLNPYYNSNPENEWSDFLKFHSSFLGP